MKRYRCKNFKQLTQLLTEHTAERAEAVRRGAETAAKRALPRVRARAPRAQGILAEHIDVKVGGKQIRIICDAPHAMAVEKGSRPHMPPIAPLIAWCTLKGFADPKAAAWAIAKKIAEHGTDPTNFMRNSLPDVMVEVQLSLFEALAGAP